MKLASLAPLAALVVSLVPRAHGALPVLEVTDVAFLGGGVADSFKGRILGRKHALKPTERIGESAARFGAWGQGNPEGELLCLPLMRALGLKAPEALLFRPGPEAPGVLATTWVDQALAGGPVREAGEFVDGDESSAADPAAFARMFLADAVVGNTDRHGGNYFVWTDLAGVVRPVPIDHNLALFPDGPEDPSEVTTIGAEWLDRSTMFAGRLAKDPGWGDLFLAQAEEVAARLTPAAIEAWVAAIPEEVPAPRRAFLRAVVPARARDLTRAVAAWRQGWKPGAAGDPPELVGRLEWLVHWAPRAAAFGARFAADLIERDSTLEAPVREFLQIPEDYPLPQGLAAWARGRVQALAAWAELDLGAQEVESAAYAARWVAALGEARSTLNQLRGLSAAEVDATLAPTLLEFAWHGGNSAEGLYRRLREADRRSEGPRLGGWRCLRLTQRMARHLWDGDLKERWERLRSLLGEVRAEVHSAAEAARLEAAATLALGSGFDRALRGEAPWAAPSQREAGLHAVLLRWGRAGLRPSAAGFDPAALALAQRRTAAAAGRRLGMAAFREAVARSTMRVPGPWLAGWDGPVPVNDPALGVAGYQRAGLSADSAARLTFERLAHGPFADWRDLAARLTDEDLLARVLVPGTPAPPPPRLVRGGGRTPFGAPSEWIHSRLDGSQLRVRVEVPGLEALEVVSIPVGRDEDGRLVVGDLDGPGVDRVAIEALGLRPGRGLPRELRPQAP